MYYLGIARVVKGHEVDFLYAFRKGFKVIA